MAAPPRELTGRVRGLRWDMVAREVDQIHPGAHQGGRSVCPVLLRDGRDGEQTGRPTDALPEVEPVQNGVAINRADEPDTRAPAGGEPPGALHEGIPGRRPRVPRADLQPGDGA